MEIVEHRTRMVRRIVDGTAKRQCTPLSTVDRCWGRGETLSPLPSAGSINLDISKVTHTGDFFRATPKLIHKRDAESSSGKWQKFINV